MSELLKKQKFGVEVEFTGITRTMAAEAVAEILGSHAAGPDRTCYRTYTIRDSKRRIWKVMRDSSICPVRKAGRELMDEYRVEFVTPPLNYEDIEALQTIIRKFKELGGVSHLLFAVTPAIALSRYPAICSFFTLDFSEHSTLIVILIFFSSITPSPSHFCSFYTVNLIFQSIHLSLDIININQ